MCVCVCVCVCVYIYINDDYLSKHFWTMIKKYFYQEVN